REMLLVGDFETPQMGVSAVHRLGLSKAAVRAGSNDAVHRINRVGDLLIKETALNDSQWFEVLLKQDVIVVRVRRFQIWVPYTSLMIARIHSKGWWKIAEVWPRNAATESHPDG